MSDFSELCPLFETGVFKEITFPYIAMTTITACGNAFLGTLTFSKGGYFTFGRTVVITDVYVRRCGATLETNTRLQINHHTSETAAATGFATFTSSVTGSGMDALTWAKFGSVTDKTFTSTDILGLSAQTGVAASAGVYDIMLRYKEA